MRTRRERHALRSGTGARAALVIDVPTFGEADRLARDVVAELLSEPESWVWNYEVREGPRQSFVVTFSSDQQLPVEPWRMRLRRQRDERGKGNLVEIRIPRPDLGKEFYENWFLGGDGPLTGYWAGWVARAVAVNFLANLREYRGRKFRQKRERQWRKLGRSPVRERRRNDRLTAAERHDLPDRYFAVPENEGLPIDTKGRLRAAMARFDQYVFDSKAQVERAFRNILRRAEQLKVDASRFKGEFESGEIIAKIARKNPDDLLERLESIETLFRAPDTLALWGIPYRMRPGQQPADIWRAENTRGWIWLGSPGWWGHWNMKDQATIQNWLDRLRDVGINVNHLNAYGWTYVR